MTVYCLDDFKIEFDKLKSKKTYSDLEDQIISYFFDKNIDDLKSGTNLNNHNEVPYIKKRLKGRGGFRFYYLLVIKEENVYLMFVHPKTGSYGASNITDESKTLLYKKVNKCIKTNSLLKLEVKDGKLTFKSLKTKTSKSKK